MPEPLSEEQLAYFKRWADRLADGPCNGCRIASKSMAALLAEVTRLRAERAAIEAECQAIARQVPNAVGPIARVLALFSPKEAL